ncbi:MAG: metallophosphoesterase [Sulfuritalea sp.]|nr:metallophosphoesterase [Sulfuritalea sp.]
MTALSILHLSDLHISEQSFNDQKPVLDALFKDVDAQRQNGLRYDLILFSGDLIAKGNYSDVNRELVKKEFLKPLLDATKLSSDRLFLVPGNHDLKVSEIPATLRPSFDAIKSRQHTNTMLDGIDKTPYFWTGFSAYNSLAKELCTATPVFENALFSAYAVTISGMQVGICCINSAWRATGSPNDADYGQLLIGERQIDLLLSAVKNCTIKLAILHHPVNWLALFDQNAIQQYLYREFDAIFYGHNHNADSLQIAGPQYCTFVSNSGCLYQSREWFNGYSIVKYQPKDPAWNIRVREYYSQRGVFDTSPRFATGGEAHFGIKLDRSSMQAITFPSVDYISAVQDSVNCHLLTATISDVAPRNLHSLFVHPPLSHLSERQLNEDNNNGEELKYLVLTDLLATHKPIFFVGPKEYGKTTLLHYICSECNDVRTTEIPRFGCYINLQSVRPTSAGLLEALVAFAKGAYRRSEFVSFLDAGKMTICFDNLPAQDDKLLSALAEFINSYPSNRLYFSVSETFQSSISQRVIPRFGLEASVVYLHAFGRRQTRSLIANWFGDSSQVLRDRVDGMLSSLRRLNIPRTPFLISILLWVQEKNITFNPVNQAEIIDILIDGILDKLHETKERSGYDSTVKRHFLTELASAMHQSNKTRCSYNELDQLAADYFSSKALPSASGPFIEELKRKGVLVDLGEDIAFKFDCLRAFFLSIKIKESPELLTFALSPEGFLGLSEELDYFTGKNRDQKEALIGALDAVEYFYKQADFELDLNLFDMISLNESPITAERKASLEKKLLGERPTFERQEEMLDEMDGQQYHPVGKVSPVPDDTKNNVTNFLNALQTASAVLRNSELINDAELKYSAYTKLINYWCQALIVILVSIECCEDEREKEAVREIIPTMPEPLAIYMMKLLIPNVIFAMAFESLGTSKLELMIKKDIKESPTTVGRLLNTVLYVDLELADRLDMLKALAADNRAGRFLIEIVFFKLLHLFMFRRLRDNEERQIKLMLGELFARLSDANSQHAINNIKNHLIKNLDRKKLMRGLVKQADDKPI